MKFESIKTPLRRRNGTSQPWGYVFATVYCMLVSVLGTLLAGPLAQSNLALVYLLVVVVATVQFGRKPGIFAAVAAVVAFDVFMARPYRSVLIADPQYLLTFVIMLAVSVSISHLMVKQQYRAEIANHRERRAHALFELSKDLSAALTSEAIADVAVRHLHKAFHAQVSLLLAERSGQLNLTTLASLAGATNLPATVAARVVYDRAQNGDDSDTITIVGGLQYLPLRAPMRTRGVLVIRTADGGRHMTDEHARVLQTFATQIALAIERVHYVDIARETEVAMESERLRNSLLSAVSHDIRTPLTAIVGLSSTLVDKSMPAARQQELALAIQSAALRMNSLVTNLLDMARLHAGAVRLQREWQMIEEVIGSALASLGPALDAVELEITVTPELPLVCFDAVLIERVLCNLIDNALKYGGGEKFIAIAAVQHGGWLEVSVEDHGPGVPEALQEKIFDKFVRGEKESNETGVGLGLAICSAIVQSHGGKLWVTRADSGGARFVFALALGTPPADGELETECDPTGTDT